MSWKCVYMTYTRVTELGGEWGKGWELTGRNNTTVKSSKRGALNGLMKIICHGLKNMINTILKLTTNK